MLKRAFILTILAISVTVGVQGQKAPAADPAAVKATAAYAEVLLRRTDIQADLLAFGQDYTDTNPKILDLKVELASLDRSTERLLAAKPTQIERLTSALGKMMVRKAALDAELAHVERSYAKEHPEVKRAQKRAELFDSAINEILK